MAIENFSKPVNLKPFRIGDSRNLKLTIRDRATKLPIDISGDKFYFTVKDSADLEDSDAVIQESIVAPTDATSQGGVVVVPVPAAATASVEPGSYQYDIVWIKTVSSPGGRDTLRYGDVSFSRAVTHAQS